MCPLHRDNQQPRYFLYDVRILQNLCHLSILAFFDIQNVNASQSSQYVRIVNLLPYKYTVSQKTSKIIFVITMSNFHQI